LKKIVITGAAGFIGSNLVDRLINKGFFVYGIDNLITGSLGNLYHLNSNNNFDFIEHDVTKYIDINDKIDYVFHFASPASPIDYLEYPIQTLKANAIGGHNTLGLAKKNNAKFILASTSEVYGDPLVHPQNESYFGNVNINGIRSCYDEGKRFSETYLKDFSEQNNLPFNTLRIFNTYGPFMASNDGRVVSNFIIQAINNENITVYGDGTQTRSLCFIDDLVGGIVRLIEAKVDNTITNIGNDKELKIIDIANIVIKLSNSSSKLVFQDLPQNDPLQRKPDLNRIRELIDWDNLTDAEDGISKTITYFKSLNEE